MSLQAHLVLSFFVVLIMCCACQTPQPILPAAPPSSYHLRLDSLTTSNLSEDMSRLSTQEDEVFVLAFVTQNGMIKARWLSSLLLFTKAKPKQELTAKFPDLSPTDRFSIFLLELDNEQLAPALVDSCATWVLAPDFPQHFNLLAADTLLGDDDLLGMQSFLLQDSKQLSPLLFEGRQLFDRYVYWLYFSSY